MKLTLPQLATAIDCEGCIGLVRAKSKYRKSGIVYEIRVSMAMTTPQYIRALRKRFGGSVWMREARQNNWKPQFCWQLGGKLAARLLGALLPYLVTKRKQALVALRFQRARDRWKRRRTYHAFLPIEAIREYEMLYQQTRALNKRGKV